MSGLVSGLVSGLRLVAHDAGDRASYDAWFPAWHAVQLASQRLGRERTAAVWTAPELRRLLARDDGRTWHQPVSAVLDGEVVGAGLLVASLVDNPDACELTVDVRPDQRRRGVGAALLAHLEGLARSRGRHVLQAEVAWPYAGDPRGAGVPELRFAEAHGFVLGLVDVQRRLDLPVAAGLLDDLAAAAAPHHAAYTVEAWDGPVPDRLVDGWAALVATLMTEAPAGEMTREPGSPDPEGVRADERVVAEMGRTKFNAVALDAAGRVVACTDVATTVHEPDRAYQWGTLVHRDHRGHRLGTAVKVANLRRLQAMRPGVTHVRTWNAEVNAPMVAVNEALGFRPVERMGELEKRLPA